MIAKIKPTGTGPYMIPMNGDHENFHAAGTAVPHEPHIPASVTIAVPHLVQFAMCPPIHANARFSQALTSPPRSQHSPTDCL
jgi:hypothetical protein